MTPRAPVQADPDPVQPDQAAADQAHRVEQTVEQIDAGLRTARTGGVVRAGLLMASATLVSRATGFLAKVILTTTFGLGLIYDAYTLGNTLPNIVFELLIGGVLTSVAIPLLSRARSDPDGGEGYTQRLVTIAFVGLLGATVLAVLAAPLLIRLYLSTATAGTQQLATSLAYLLLPQILFYGLAALFGAILNAKERFGIPAWAPVINNLVVIGVAVGLNLANGGPIRELTRTQFLILGLGTTFGIVLQAAIMLPALHRSGFRFRWRWGGDRRLLEAGGLLLWTLGYVGVSQIGYIVVTNVAGDAYEGAYSTFATASLLLQLPYGIIGVSILTAIMPRMSRHAAAGQLDAVKSDASLATRLSIVALTPVAAGMAVLATAIAIITTKYGAVNLDSAILIGSTLAALALGLVPLAVTLVQMRVFYAMKDARTPTLINAVMVVVRVPLMIACIQLDERWVVPGLAAATSLSYLVGAVTGEIWLRSRYGSMRTRRTLVTLVKMTLAGAIGAGAALLVSRRLLDLQVVSLGPALLEVAVVGLVGLVVIAAVATLLKVEELIPVRDRVLRLLGLGRRTGGDTPTGPDGSGGGGPQEAPTTPSDGPRDTLPGQTAPPAGQPTGGDGVPPVAASAAGAVDQRPDPSPETEQVSPAVSKDDSPTSGRRWETLDDDADALAALPRADRSAPASRAPLDPPAPGAVTSDIGDQRNGDQSDGDQSAGTPEDRDPTDGPGTGTGDEAPVLLPGTVVGGRYRLLSLVSTDAQGHRFWRAKDSVLPRDMAVTLLPDTTGASATVARTLRAGRLHHIGLPQTLDVGTDQGQSYVVGQWVDGNTLTEMLQRGPLEDALAASITGKVSDAVAEAHRNGIALGALNPDLIRVTEDGQVRLSHVIAHASATPDQDIRAVGALLYLMLTGSWPLPEARTVATAGHQDDLPTLPAAPTRRGREVPAVELRPQINPALSTLAERALHPDEPDGIHAVGAVTALLAAPEVEPVDDGDEEMVPLNAADRRLVRERRVKLSLALTVLAVFAALIVIVVASLGKQALATVQNTTPIDVSALETGPPASSSAAEVAPAPAPTTEAPATTEAAPSTPAPPPAAPVGIVGGTVYDPEGDGNKDYTSYVDRAYDGNPDTAWLTLVYFQQFPTLKPGVGITVQLERAVTPTSVTVTSPSPGTVIEIRTATGPDQPLDQTQVVGTGVVLDGGGGANADLVIPVTAAPSSSYLTVFVTKMNGSGRQWQSKISEIQVTGS
ncbi:murein biosynthesis integral membrane protein MurJ [Nakamurella flavida]|uniref:Murein biosynthesis integral membrane protein MurJ n=1 Tax=Nakamurella flavida TaxID=363630 RepID=A0A938YKF0_9ACTN|nr:murein biosynthesis integral membrane protein MurJ [Nakamurella flavida]MBM9476799.1 murein biosynthesis integral membrane protein MurJ [Nakamurella flavida]MDP9778763.1 putative peptidoglycan lipid II flippase [Nakamurella flavida]